MGRDLKGLWRNVVFWVALLFAVFQLYTSGFGFLLDIKQRAVHIIFALSLVFFTHSFRRRAQAETKVPWWDLLLIGIVLAANINIFFVWETIYISPGESATKDLILGVLLSLVVVESVRRVNGWIIPAMLGLAFLYLFAGPYLPGMWRSRGLPLEHIIESVYYSPNGIYGAITGLSATLIAIFIVFGTLLQSTGGGKAFIDIAIKLSGRFRGGPAKVAVISSAFFGTISGSAVANVVVTGTYTIPMMKSLGYRSQFAGAVEATASTGGMLTPPILGSAAFIMAELLGISYLKIMLYSIIPCVLFYTSVYTGVHLDAVRFGLGRVPEAEIPSWKQILTWSTLGPLVLPVIILLVLIVKGFSITYSAFFASMAVIVLFLFSDFSGSGIRGRFFQVGRSLSLGGKALIEIAPLFVGISVLLNLLSLSGVLVNLSGFIVDLGAISLKLALFVAALVPILLGMAVSAVASYVLSISIVAPALLGLGVQVIPLHMFLFYYSCLAPITPPVCTACYVAANIAKADWVKVAFVAVRLAMVAFILPFFFITEPALLGMGAPAEVLHVAFTGFLGAMLFAFGFFGYREERTYLFSRALFLLGGFLLLKPGWESDVQGILLGGSGFVLVPVVSRAAHLLQKLKGNVRKKGGA